MKYLCLAYHENGNAGDLADEIVDYRNVLLDDGYYITSSPVQPAEMVVTIRVRNGKMAITEGPFAESKQQLGGFFLIEAADLNDAIRVASKMPPARLGCIEVRPLMEIGLE
jgi:hypothetical protein